MLQSAEACKEARGDASAGSAWSRHSFTKQNCMHCACYSFWCDIKLLPQTFYHWFDHAPPGAFGGQIAGPEPCASHLFSISPPKEGSKLVNPTFSGDYKLSMHNMEVFYQLWAAFNLTARLSQGSLLPLGLAGDCGWLHGGCGVRR